ncbi:hypothetical protein AURDEDRAFT_184526 [Auricularia subglabra TFB-10046 SS5]|nr:hypothetical protein AURDEDRAFT_184526 [Auricularia subglabra TFB-10046 SS5]
MADAPDDEGHALLPIACRFVPADVWLTTHIEYSWTVREVKQWLVTKCNADSQAARLPPVDVPGPRFRAGSPVGFASVRSSEDFSDSETDAALSLDGHASLNAHARSRRAQRVRQLERANTGDDISAQFCLISFSNGHILEDGLKISTYNLRPYELLELQRRNDSVYVSRRVYLKPHFDMPLLVLKIQRSEERAAAAANLTISTPDSSRFGTIRASKGGVARVPSDPDMRARRAPRKGRTNARAPQWKERRLVLKDDRITIWRDRQDKEPIAAFDLAQLVALHAPEHTGLRFPCSCGSADAAQCTCSEELGAYVVCARFAPPEPEPRKRQPQEKPQRRQIPGGDDGDARMYAGMPYFRSSASLAPKTSPGKGSVRARASTDADKKPADSGSDAERARKAQDELLVLRLPDERSFNHLLRVLHYTETKVPLTSTFVSAAPSRVFKTARVPSNQSSPSSASASSPQSTPTTAATSDMSPFPSLKLRKSARPTTILDLAAMAEPGGDATHRSLLYHHDHPALSISVRYPAWRQHVLQRAERAGRGRLSQPNEVPSDSETETDGWAYDFQCRLERRLALEPAHVQAMQQHNLRSPPRVRSAESLREKKKTPGSPLRERILSHTGAGESKRRKLSISIFIPGGGSAGSGSSAAVARSRSASVASPTPTRSPLPPGPRRKPSSGSLFGQVKPGGRPAALAHQTSNSTLGTAYETDGDPTPRLGVGVLRKPRRSGDTSGSDRRVRSASVSIAGSGSGPASRAGSPFSAPGHARSRGPSESSAEAQLPLTPLTPTPTPNIPVSGFGRLVRGFSIRK